MARGGKALGATLVGAALGASCGGGSSDGAATDAPRNAALVAERLAPDAPDALGYGPGTTPVTEGSWLRLPPSTSWTWQLKGPINLDYEVDLYVVDLFDRIADDTVERLHAAGRNVLCYRRPGRARTALRRRARARAAHAGAADRARRQPQDELRLRRPGPNGTAARTIQFT